MTFHYSIFAVANLVFTIIFGIGFGWLAIILKSFSNLQTSNPKVIEALMNIWMLGVSLTLCLGMFFNGVNNDELNCGKSGSLKSFGCGFPSGDAAEGNAPILFLLPTFFAMVVKGLRWDFQIITLVANTLTFVVVIGYYHLPNSLIGFLGYLFIGGLFLYTYHLQELKLFFALERQAELTIANEQTAELEHLEEMRSLIGNMAHDLKTVK